MGWSNFTPAQQANILGSAGGVADSLIGGAFSLGGAALQHKYNKEMASIQNQYNLDMWKMNNEYNTPANQMARLKDAGLNPNLMYSQGNVGNSSSAPQQVAPNAPDIQSAMRDAAKSLNPVQIIELIQSVRKSNADIVASEERAKILGLEANMLAGQVRALQDPMVEFNLDDQTFRKLPYSMTVMKHDNPYLRFGEDVGQYYYSWLNAIKAARELGAFAKDKQTTLNNIKRGTLLQNDIDWYDTMKGASIAGKFAPMVNNILIGILRNLK